MQWMTVLCAGALALVAGCAGTRIGPAIELEPLEGFEVDYRGGIGDAGDDVTADPPEFTQSEEDTESGYTIEARFLKMSLGDAVDAFGDGVTDVGVFAVPSDAPELSELAQGRSVASPRLTVFNGQTGTISLENETAYVSGFDLEGHDGTRVVDPVVDVVKSGLMLGLKAESVESGRVRLSLDLLLSDVSRPIATHEAKVFGSSVKVQTPVLMNQRVKAEGVVSEDRTLVLTGMIGDDGDVTVLLLRSARMTFSNEPGIEPGIPDGD